MSSVDDTSRLRALGQRARERPISASVLISLAGVALGWAVTWGAYSQRLQAVEKDSHDQAIEVQDAKTKLFSHDTQLAVVQTQLAAISAQLTHILGKLEREEQREKRREVERP